MAVLALVFLARAAQASIREEWLAWVAMTNFLRGKQAGIQRDFSAGLDPQLFAIDEARSLPLMH